MTEDSTFSSMTEDFVRDSRTITWPSSLAISFVRGGSCANCVNYVPSLFSFHRRPPPTEESTARSECVSQELTSFVKLILQFAASTSSGTTALTHYMMVN